MGCNAHEFIVALPKGYETVVGQKGMQLSGGQRQRICIARALVSGGRGSVLCLDEPTSSLDWESALVICQTLRTLLERRDRSVILVSHHAGLMPFVDRVALLSGGEIVAFGTHAELQASCEAYRLLFAI